MFSMSGSPNPIFSESKLARSGFTFREGFQERKPANGEGVLPTSLAKQVV